MNICIIELKFESMRSVSWKEELLLVFGFLEKRKHFVVWQKVFDISKLDLLFQVNEIVHLKIMYCSNLISWPRTDDERNCQLNHLQRGQGSLMQWEPLTGRMFQSAGLLHLGNPIFAGKVSQQCIHKQFVGLI